jgi:hypothetical protein
MTAVYIENDEANVPSRKREVTAVVIATTVGIVLTVGASIFINKIQARVKESIAPTTEDE